MAWSCLLFVHIISLPNHTHFQRLKVKGKKNQLPMLDYIFWSHYLQSLIISGFETFNSVKMLIIVVEIQC